jgi:voltage-gated potassium channel
VERLATPEDIGQSLDSLPSGGRGLRIYRAGRSIGFWEPAALSIESGDFIVEIRPTAQAEGAR